MKHPILSSSGYKIYVLIWMMVIVVHGSVLYFYHHFDLEVSLVDSLVFNLIFGVIAPGLWFVVNFGGLNRDRLSLMTTHVGAASLTIIFWLTVSSYVLKLLLQTNEQYLDFLSNSTVWRVIIGAFFYSITMLIFYLIKYYQDMQQRMNKELELQNLLKDSELRMLKSQINPHFIFNSLNSISALTELAPHKAREMVIKLSEFLRYSLGKDTNELNPLAMEIESATNYLEIEKVRFGDRLRFEKQVSEKCRDIDVPNLILQPLLENAIKFGLYDNLESVTIRLECQSDKDMLLLRIINNFDPEAIPSKGEGIGLDNVRRRMSLIYGRGDLVSIKKLEGEFVVIIQIPINNRIEK